jgi:predicted HicB family RNase H-like nuclease
MSGKVTLTVRVSEELDAWVRDEALLRESSLSGVVESALKDAKEKAA